MLAGLLLILLGAFMQVNRSQFAMLGGSADREIALRTIMTAQEYCSDMLERNQDWGAVDFPADRDDVDLLGYMTVVEKGGTRQVTGEIPSLHSTFTVDVNNTLTTNERVELEITAEVGTLKRVVKVSMRPAPVYDSAIAAGGGIQVSASEWTLGSRDPYRNVVRARGNIDAPDHADVHFVGKQNTASENGTDQGIFWAKNDITFYVGASAESVSDPLVLQDAIADTGGMFFPNSGVNHTIHDLQASDVSVPAGSSSIQDGEYRFTELDCTYQKWVKVSSNPDRHDWRTRTETIPVMQRLSSAGGLTDYWFSQVSLPGTTKDPTFSVGGTPHEELDTTFDLDVGNLVEVTLDTPTARPEFKVQADGLIKIPGSFKVTSTAEDPLLSFQGLTGNSQIEADGDVAVQGEIQGNGIVISKNGSVKLDLTSAATTGNQLGVSLFAANDIEINATGAGDLSFSGLLFARENVAVNGVDKDFNVDGALVARNGNISINTGGKVDLTYNPDHLKVLLEELPDNRTKLETLVWKE
jgi:hypothetical protein